MHHRPERRRQDHDDGRRDRQDASGSRLRVVRAGCGPAGALGARDRTGGDRAQVPEAHGVREPDGVREPGARHLGRQVVLEGSRRSADARPAPAHRRHPRRHRARGRARRAGGDARARTEAMARDRHAPHAGAGPAARRRAGRRHDAAGDRENGGAPALARCGAFADRRGARHGFRAVDREARDGASRRAARSRSPVSIRRTAGAARCGTSTSPWRPDRAPASWAATAWGRRRS